MTSLSCLLLALMLFGPAGGGIEEEPKVVLIDDFSRTDGRHPTSPVERSGTGVVLEVDVGYDSLARQRSLQRQANLRTFFPMPSLKALESRRLSPVPLVYVIGLSCLTMMTVMD